MSYKWLVDSENHSLTYPSSFGDVVTVDLTSLIKTPKISRVRVRRVFLPNVVYNVTANNGQMTLTIGVGAPVSITIPAGYYSGPDLCTKVAALLNAAAGVGPTYLVEVTWSSSTYLVTVSVRDTTAPPPGYTPFVLSASLATPSITPDVLQLLGFNVNPLNAATGTSTSNGPLNSSPDRYAVITCDEAKGMNGALYSVGTKATAYGGLAKPWHDGLVSIVPLTGSQGDVVEYFPENDAPWTTLIRPHTNGTLTFRLGRDRYQTFGPKEISWSMLLEVD